jgi:uncharacterized protein YdcH (DUF465 family)
MTEKLIDKLLEYIDARIAEKSCDARNSSDGGLLEVTKTWRVKDELYEIIQSIEDKQ